MTEETEREIYSRNKQRRNDYYEDDYEKDKRQYDDYYERPRERAYRNNYDYDEDGQNYNVRGEQRRSSGVAYVNNYRGSRCNKSEQDGYYDEDYENQYEEAAENKKNSPKSGQLLIIIQIISCIIIIGAALLLKSLGGEYYTKFQQWYQTEISKSLIAGEGTQDYQNSQNKSSSNAVSEKAVSSKPVVSMQTTGLTGNCVTMSTMISKPLDTGIITSEFNENRGSNSAHKGLDIAAPTDTKILSVLSGTVCETGENDSYGKYIIVDHKNGISTLYAHCNGLIAQKDQEVLRKTPIAYVGSTGDSTGDHLHLELIINKERYNPQPLIEEGYA